MTDQPGGTCTSRSPEPRLGWSGGTGIGAAPGLDVAVEDGIAVLTVRGHLDAAMGERVVNAAESALDHAARRLDIDLRQVASFTEEGVAALRACRTRAARLREGLHYRTGRGPGRDALLAAYPPADID